MRELEATLDDVFLRQERLTRDEIQRRAMAAQAPIDVINALDGLPEGEYAQDEVAEALDQVIISATPTDIGIASTELDDEDLLREMAEIHRTRSDTLRHGSEDALATHTSRMAELEAEYLRRNPQREIDPQRMRGGARARRDQPGRIVAVEDTDEVERAIEDEAPVASLAPQPSRQPRTGSDQPWEPRDFAIARGMDPTPENIEWARRVLAEEGQAAIERTVP